MNGRLSKTKSEEVPHLFTVLIGGCDAQHKGSVIDDRKHGSRRGRVEPAGDEASWPVDPTLREEGVFLPHTRVSAGLTPSISAP